MAALFKFFACRAAHPFQYPDTEIGVSCAGFFRTQMFGLKVLVIETVKQEIRQVRHDRLRAFRL